MKSLLVVCGVAAIVAVGLASCFSPDYANTRCSAAGECPPGFVCDPASNLCVGTNAPTDAPGADAQRVDAFVPPDAPTDATPVGCDGDSDCQTPPDNCSLAGTCNLTTNECEFPAVDCSSLDGVCTVGVCEFGTGNCVAQPHNEGNSCSADTVTNCATCGGFTGECGEDGTQACTCTSFACSSGACMPSATSCDEPCTRSTTGIACGSGTTLSSCGACGYTDSCDESAVKNCTCTDFTCGGGTCNAGAGYSCTDACVRDTENNVCGAGNGDVVSATGCQYTGGVCDETGTNTRTCRDWDCTNGSCTASANYSCNLACNRVTDGNTCDFGQNGCPNGSFREMCCNTTGSCSVPCGPCEQ